MFSESVVMDVLEESSVVLCDVVVVDGSDGFSLDFEGLGVN